MTSIFNKMCGSKFVRIALFDNHASIVSFSSISKVNPQYPVEHTQVYSLVLLKKVPPALHGNVAQSLISNFQENKQINVP